MLATVKKIEKQLQSGESMQTAGKYTYLYGTMDYQIDPPSGNLQKITFTLHLNTGETGQGFGYYDQNLKKMSKWVEKN